MIGLIARRELRALFLSPVAWVVLAGVQLVLAWIFLVHLQDFIALQPRRAELEVDEAREIQLEPGAPGLSRYLAPRLFAPAASIIMLVTPLLSMRLVAEELRNGSFRLLQSAPVDMARVLLGKYLALLALLGLMLLLCLAMPLALWPFVALDLGLLGAASLGVACVLALSAAIGLYFSCLTRQPAIAAFAAFAALLLLWLVGGAGGSQSETGPVLAWLSMPEHLDGFLRGRVDTADLAYFALATALFLLLGVRRLDNLRLL